MRQGLAATTVEGNQKQDERSLAARKIASKNEPKANTEELAPPPNPASGGDLVNDGRTLRPLLTNGPAKHAEDAVDVELSGGDGRDEDEEGGSSGRYFASSTGSTAAGECTRVDDAQGSSATGVIRTPKIRSSASKGGGTRLAHNVVTSNPLSAADALTTPTTALGAPSPGTKVATPFSKGKSRKRARDAEKKDQGERRRRKGGPKMPARGHRRVGGESGGQQNQDTRKRRSALVLDSKCGSDGAGGGGSVDRGGRHAIVVLNEAKVLEDDPRPDVGLEERVTGWDGVGDAHSTIVWYKTIVACLTAAAS